MNIKNKSFTLIEILVAITIIAIISGLIIVSLNGASSASHNAKRKTDIDALRSVLLLYGLENGSYPTQTLCNIGQDCDDLDSALIPDYFSSLPLDPVSGYYTYDSDGTDFTISTVLSNSYTYSYSSLTGFSNTSPPEYASTCAAATIPGVIQCTETYDGSYVINKFTLLGTVTGTTNWEVPAGVTSVEYLVVAGGGGGGGHSSNSAGGGGGAGGFLTASGFSVSGAVSVTVGAGGAGGLDGYLGSQGENSIFSTITAIGGGRGGINGTSGGVGGSGGGGNSRMSPLTGGGGTAGQGRNGGNGTSSTGYGSGGGGGAGQLGGTAVAGQAGKGGDGLPSSITGGSPVTYAGGGGGGVYSGAVRGLGGSGGGGNGGPYASPYDGSPGTNNLGGGGGGAGYHTAGDGGKGGSGVVIIRYLHP
jgi:prepilin-type N-terminal cleavage/methylation domain-containing protein